jgi:hypothetical protein
MEKTGEERNGIMESKIARLEQSDVRLWLAIEKLQSRPPAWAVAIISFLTFLVGFLLTFAIMMIKNG